MNSHNNEGGNNHKSMLYERGTSQSDVSINIGGACVRARHGRQYPEARRQQRRHPRRRAAVQGPVLVVPLSGTQVPSPPSAPSGHGCLCEGKSGVSRTRAPTISSVVVWILPWTIGMVRWGNCNISVHVTACRRVVAHNCLTLVYRQLQEFGYKRAEESAPLRVPLARLITVGNMHRMIRCCEGRWLHACTSDSPHDIHLQ